MEIFEKGMTVYANSCWHTAEMCEIIDFIKNESSTHKNVYKLHSLSFGGNFAITEDCVFNTRKEALDAAKLENFYTPIRKENIMNKPLGNYMLISTDGVSLDDYSFFTSLEKARDTMELAYKSKLNLITNRLGYRPDDYKIHDNEAWIYSEEYGRTIWNIIKIVE